MAAVPLWRVPGSEGGRVNATEDAYRVTAIECVAKLSSALADLDTQVVGGAGRRDVAGTVNDMRHLLRVLTDATMRDGRWPGYSPRSTPRNAPWLFTARAEE